ncbi:MAG: hypothetical protein WA020_15400 [Candidatus Acidiferrales bacterium]
MNSSIFIVGGAPADAAILLEEGNGQYSIGARASGGWRGERHMENGIWV